jgi:hypothetical protein
VNHHTGAEGHLYAIRFSSGTVKVGLSRDVPQRIATHVSTAAIHDVTAECIWVSEPVDRLEEREQDLLTFCAARWEVAAGGEYFRRADLAEIVRQANGMGVPTRELRGPLAWAPPPGGLSTRAQTLRTAIEKALESHTYAIFTPGCTRIYAPAPAPGNPRWKPVLQALQGADQWGSTNTTGVPEIWAEIHDEVSA